MPSRPFRLFRQRGLHDYLAGSAGHADPGNRLRTNANGARLAQPAGDQEPVSRHIVSHAAGAGNCGRSISDLEADSGAGFSLPNHATDVHLYSESHPDLKVCRGHVDGHRRDTDRRGAGGHTHIGGFHAGATGRPNLCHAGVILGRQGRMAPRTL